MVDRPVAKAFRIVAVDRNEGGSDWIECGRTSATSGSWSGGAPGAPRPHPPPRTAARDRARAPDIIDLDKFMRGAVRPSRPDNALLVGRERLVVDGGGGVGGRRAGGNSSSSASRAPPRHSKRFSHDSGLSDGSYVKRKQRPHRRAAVAVAGGVEGGAGAGGRESRSSLRAFRAVCERALLDQQQQIARVAALCERLTERQRAPAPRSKRSDSRKENTPSTDSSEITSSSRTTADWKNKDKQRTDECKTYKIIMSKLDELNRMFAGRARAVAAPHPPPRPRPAAPSSGSVSVSDKLVATDPELLRGDAQAVHRCETRLAGAGTGSVTPAAGGAGSGRRAGAAACRLATPAPRSRAAHDAARAGAGCRQADAGASGSGSACDARCGFDLEDPIHLYTQAKRLQALGALGARGERASVSAGEEGAAAGAGARGGAPTLCALCRTYWRALRHYVVAQLFPAPAPAP